jgi:tetratricopeptide (TPR) repeat protein
LRQFGPDHPKVAVRRSNLASILRNLGEHAAAREQIERALESDLRQFGPDHPKVAVHRWNLAAVLFAQADCAGALREIDEALRVFRLKLPAGHPDTKNAEAWRAGILAALGRQTE